MLSNRNLLLFSITAPISSAASSVILLLLMRNSDREEIFCTAFAILMISAARKLFPLMTSVCNLLQFPITVAISSAASSVMLLLVMCNSERKEILCNAIAILMIVDVRKPFLPPMSSICNLL